jgi:hypothetical protein
VAWVAEPGLRIGTLGGGSTAFARRSMAAGLADAGDQQIIDVSPEEIEVEVALEVGFSLSPG